jgi:hypothetical protein
MAKRNRASLLKRQREADKREREAKRAARAALKRERRMQKRCGDSPIAPGEDAPDNGAANGTSAADADDERNPPVAGPGASGDGTAASESGR